MSFVASGAVEALDWDFRPYLKAYGTITEPSDDQVKAMNKALRAATVAVTGEDFDPQDRKALVRVFGKLSDEQLAEMEQTNLDAIAIVTGTSPAREDIERLPFRIKRAFLKWLITELNGPEG